MTAEKFGLAESTVLKIRDANISEVVSHFVPLKKKGALFQACCPFHEEHTPSFTVSDVKNIYKCFGCGAGGDSIRFVMNYERLTFIQACKKIAQICNIEIEFEERPFNKQLAEKQEAAQLQENVLNIVVPIYTANLLKLEENHPAKLDLYNRGITPELWAEWQLGWAGTDWKGVTSLLINQNLYEPAKALGIIKTSDSGNSYDGYRSRIIIPVQDQYGKYIGLAGRYIAADPQDEGREYAKYMNPPECALYSKSRVLFGLNRAAKAIDKQKKAILVEGYFDVINPHGKGLHNIIATAGTAFTPEQMQLLKKHTTHVQLMRDNDNPGQEANIKQLPELLKMGFYVDVIKYKEHDPDAWAKSLAPLQENEKRPEPEAIDAVKNRAHEIKRLAGDDVRKRAAAKAEILQLLTHIQDGILRNEYLDSFCESMGMRAGETRKELAALLESKEQANAEAEADDFTGWNNFLPPWLTDTEKEIYNVNGYVPLHKEIKGKPIVGYYQFGPKGSKIEISNFIVRPLFHVYAGADSRFMLQIDNGYLKSVIDMPARNIPSIEMFQAAIVPEGNFIIFGARTQWLRIASDLLHQFPRCEEITTLGWQQSGFYAFVDKVFTPGTGKLADPDNYGIIEHKDRRFLIPAACEAYRQLDKTGRDPYENDRPLSYSESPISFSEWAAKMWEVYDESGLVGIGAVVMSLFRDIVFSVDHNCPHIWGFGEPGSGKSKWAESITAPFYGKIERAAFNLNSGTDYAFFSYMQRFTNAPAHLNEFDYEVVKIEWFEALKGVFDGEGREKGKIGAGAGSKNRTEVMRVLALLVLTGQKLITANDNSMVTRSIIESFSEREEKKTTQAKELLDDLKDLEKRGISSILIELLKHRAHFDANYKNAVNTLLGTWRKDRPDAKGINTRILHNYAHLSTCYSMAGQFIKLPAETGYFENYCFKQAKRWSSFIKNSDTLSEFWRTLEFLVNSEEVIDGWDYAIKEVAEIKVRKGHDEEISLQLPAPTKVLFLRLNNIHKLFQQAFRTRTGKEAMSIDNLLHYFSSRKYYLGNVKKFTFRKWTLVTEANEGTPYGGAGLAGHSEKRLTEQRTSCHAFIYSDLGLEIETNNALNADEIPYQ